MQEKTFEILCKKISGLFTGNIHQRVHSLLFLLLLLFFFILMMCLSALQVYVVFSNFYLFFFSAWPSHLPQLGFTVFNWMYFFYYLLFVSYLTYSVINSFLIFRFWYHLFWDFSLQKLNRTLKKDLFLLMLLLQLLVEYVFLQKILDLKFKFRLHFRNVISFFAFLFLCH